MVSERKVNEWSLVRLRNPEGQVPMAQLRDFATNLLTIDRAPRMWWLEVMPDEARSRTAA